MEHAASPSLISFGLTSQLSAEGPSFRWGLVSSCVLHALVIIMAMFIRFQSESEHPLRAIDVALISLPATPVSAPKPSPPVKKSPVVAQPPKNITPPAPTPPVPPPTAPPIEDALPPLPTESASERLSESFGGAINSIVVPQQREMNSPTIPPEELALHPTIDQSPLIDNLRLPSAPPTIARPKRLQPAEPLKTPSSARRPIPSVQKNTPPTPEKAPSPSPPPQAKKIQPAITPPPAIPSLKEVTPFNKPQQETMARKTLPTSKLEDSLKRSLPNISTPAPTTNLPKISQKRSAAQRELKSSTPRVSAPKLTEIPELPKPKSPTQAPPKLSETVKKLMEGLKTTTRRPAPKHVAPSPTKPSESVTPSPTPPPAAIDQRIAKLSIPEVSPVESIKQRLQLLDVQATGGAEQASSKPSPGKNRYLAMVEDAIDRQWRAPPLLESTPVVVMKFRIDRSGEISRIHIAESSGHVHYDSAAQRAVQAVNPLPQFPPDISDSFFDVTYRFIKD